VTDEVLTETDEVLTETDEVLTETDEVLTETDEVCTACARNKAELVPFMPLFSKSSLELHHAALESIHFSF
jgi:hypothetical protein